MSSLKDVITNPSVTVNLLRKYNIRPSKKLGQSFLVDSNIAKKLINISDISANDKILEIGPGFGALTQFLINTKAKIAAVEIDKKLFHALIINFSEDKNVFLINDDSLKINRKKLPFTPNKLIANLPYSVASPLLIKYLFEFPEISFFTVMIQKDVAEKILAKPSTSNYSNLTVKLNYLGQIKRAFNVSPSVFIPKPKVESSVLLIKRKHISLNEHEILEFFKFVDLCFSQRRKKLINNLASQINIDKSVVRDIFTKNNIELSLRAENLSIEEIFLLFSNFR